MNRMGRAIACCLAGMIVLLQIMSEITLAENARMDDPFYSMLYNMAVQDAEAAGYQNYEIEIDENYNVKLHLYGSPKSATNSTEPKNTEEPEKNENVAQTVQTEAPIEEIKSEREIKAGLHELNKDNIVGAMKHFLKALPNNEAEKLIYSNAHDYIDELMFSEKYETAQQFMLDHPFDGYEPLLAECNDYCFLTDLARGLNARWKKSNQDTTTWSDKKVREFYQELVECETKYLDKYIAMGFSDSQLAEYAFAYIGALQSQLTGVAYYGVDNEKFNENWVEHGAQVRYRLIYLINKKYEIKINASNQQDFKDAVQRGRTSDFLLSLSESFTEQLSTADISFKKNSKGIQMNKITLKNTSGYTQDWGIFTVKAFFLDQNGNTISEKYICGGDKMKDGEELKCYDVQITEPFDSYHFVCSDNYQTTDSSTGWASYEMYYFTVNPKHQVSWDGKNIIIDGNSKGNDEQISFGVEDVKTKWTEYKNVFVPSIEFVFRNNGSDNVKEATIECVFVDKDTNIEWSREKYFAVNQSDSPLQSGRGRDIIIYSKKGYEKKTRKVPSLSVELYVNGEPLYVTEVDKP